MNLRALMVQKTPDWSMYRGASITDITVHDGRLYGCIRSADGQMLVGSTLDCCLEVLKERMPK
jgi:hypothetical protein